MSSNDEADHHAWVTAGELVDRHGVSATRVATEQKSKHSTDAAKAFHWQRVADYTVRLLRDRGELD